MLNLVPVMWLECCVPSGGQSDATETAQLVPQDAFLLHYWEERWQSLKWHKLSACIVLNQSSRRALKRSAVRSQHGHNKHSPHTAWDSYLVRQHHLYSNLKSCLHYISATKSTLAIVLLRMFKKYVISSHSERNATTNYKRCADFSSFNLEWRVTVRDSGV